MSPKLKIQDYNPPKDSAPKTISLTSLSEILSRQNVDRIKMDDLRAAFLLDKVNCPFGREEYTLEDLDLKTDSDQYNFWKLLLEVASGLKRPDVDESEFIKNLQNIFDQKGQCGPKLWSINPAFFKTEIVEGFFKAWGILLPPLPSEELKYLAEQPVSEHTPSNIDLQYEIKKAKYGQCIRVGHLAMILNQESYNQTVKDKLILKYKLGKIETKIGRGMPFWNLYLGVKYRLLGPFGSEELRPLFSDKDCYGQSISRLRELGDHEERNESHFTKFADLRELFDCDDIPPPLSLFPETPDASIDEDVVLVEDLKQNAFRLNMDVWEIVFEGQKTNLKDCKGIRYLLHLLANPGKEISAIELSQLVQGSEIDFNREYSKLSEEELQKEHLTKRGYLSDQVSGKDLEEEKTNARKLWDIAESQPENEEAQRAWESCKDIYLAEYRIKIDDSKEDLKFFNFNKSALGKDVNAARSNITKQINAVKKRIEKALPPLGEHLRAVDTGAIFIYRPCHEDPIQFQWKISGEF